MGNQFQKKKQSNSNAEKIYWVGAILMKSIFDFGQNPWKLQMDKIDKISLYVILFDIKCRGQYLLDCENWCPWILLTGMALMGWKQTGIHFFKPLQIYLGMVRIIMDCQLFTSSWGINFLYFLQWLISQYNFSLFLRMLIWWQRGTQVIHNLRNGPIQLKWFHPSWSNNPLCLYISWPCKHHTYPPLIWTGPISPEPDSVSHWPWGLLVAVCLAQWGV